MFVGEMNVYKINDTLTPPPTSLNETNVIQLVVAPYVTNIILGLPTNGYVLWLIVTGAGGTIASEFFALNLTVSEILFCLFKIVSIIELYLMPGPLSATSFSYGFIHTGRSLFQCCICVERYLAVVHPVVFLKYKPLRYRVGCCVVVWLMVFGSCCASLLMNFSTMMVNLLMGEFIVYFVVMLFCCLSVLKVLKRPGPGDGEREGTNNMKMRAFKIVLIILVSTVVTYLPFIVIAALMSHISKAQFILAAAIDFCIVLVCGFVQPLLYLHRVGKLPCIRGL